MPYYVKMRRNGRLCGKLGPFSTQKLAVKQAQPLADDAADDVVVTVEPAATSNPKSKKKAKAKRRPRRRRNYSPVPGSPPLASATDSLVDWSPMNARTARSMERMGMAPRKKNSRRRNVYSMKVGSYYMASYGRYSGRGFVKVTGHYKNGSAKTIAVMDDPGVRGHGKAKQMSVTKQDMSIYHPVAFADMPAFVQAAFRKKNSRRRNTSMPRGRAGTVRQGTLKLGK